uniref:Forkhead box protein E1-like n=1 Tax=Saccoglossus kowalevskii TaxID=10224 RepID=A0ABM0MPR1_SACKO|nr:PREDICTED: forkhead box protein E1-like [Saccoglossus kowalevskii]
MTMYSNSLFPNDIYSNTRRTYAFHPYHNNNHIATDNINNHPYVADRPPYSFVALITMAIRSHHNQKATLKDIYGCIKSTFPYYRDKNPSWENSIRHNISMNSCFKATLKDIYGYIKSTFPYYRDKNPSWKNSIRHNLSMNSCFVKIDRSVHDQTHGHFWGLSAGWEEMFTEGNYRRRVRGYRRSDSRSLSSSLSNFADASEQKYGEQGFHQTSRSAVSTVKCNQSCPELPVTRFDTPSSTEKTTKICKDFSISSILGCSPKKSDRSVKRHRSQEVYPITPSSPNHCAPTRVPALSHSHTRLRRHYSDSFPLVTPASYRVPLHYIVPTCQATSVITSWAGISRMETLL